MTPADLLIPLAVAAIIAGLGVLGHRHPGGKHHHTPRRLGRRQRHAIEEALHAAWQARVEHHAPGPLRARQLEVAALTATLPSWTEPATGPLWPPMWAAVPPQDGPVPTALADVRDDPDYPHLDRPDWEYATGQWPAFVDSIKGESSGLA